MNSNIKSLAELICDVEGSVTDCQLAILINKGGAL